MKKLFTTLTTWIALGAAVPAFAGPDWQAIERARQNKRAQVAQMEKLTPAQKCAARQLVLPLDHGPRAQSTPYLNQRRSESFEADLKACKEAAAKGIAQ
ncbi:MAG: hypothetical protein JNJ42_08385 [Burkholderiaceae bacterium]|nr:hypothetical protein [Burkholderiaceae bacterium]